MLENELMTLKIFESNDFLKFSNDNRSLCLHKGFWDRQTVNIAKNNPKIVFQIYMAKFVLTPKNTIFERDHRFFVAVFSELDLDNVDCWEM